MADNLKAVHQEIKKTNEAVADVRENTELSASYLDLTVDMISERFNSLFDIIQRDVDVSQRIARSEGDNDRNMFQGLQIAFVDKLDELLRFMRGVQKEEKDDSLDELEKRREEKRDGDVGKVERDDYIQDFLKTLSEKTDEILKVIGTILGIVISPFVLIGAYFKELGAQVAVLDNLLKGGLSRFFSPITRLFKAIGESKFIQSILTTWRETVVPFFKRIGLFFGLIKKASDGTIQLGKILATASRLGVFLARFNPFILGLVGAFEFVTGFIDGFERGGFIEGLKQATVDVFDALLGGLIRLLFDIPAFLLKLIGLKDLGSSLSNFGNTLVDTIITSFESAVDLVVGLFTLDFEKIKKASIAGGEALIDLASAVGDLILTIATTIWDLFTSVTHSIADKIVSFNIGDMLGEFASSAADFLRTILRSVLPDPTTGGPIERLAKKAIPAPLYEFAGLDPKTGEEVEVPEEEKVQVEAGSSPSRVAAGTELQQEAETQRDAEREALGRVGGPGSNAVSVATNIQNNSNTTFTQRPPASSQPDNMSDTMMSQGFTLSP